MIKRKKKKSSKSKFVTRKCVMSYAASLQLQCYMFIVGHLEELSPDLISLLPIAVRRKLLLMLPVLDVCKLEETPVTDGISIDEEIWKNKCRHGKFHCFYETYTASGASLTWKDCYFQVYSLEVSEVSNLVGANMPECVDCFTKETRRIQQLYYITYAWPLSTIFPHRYKAYVNNSICFRDSAKSTLTWDFVKVLADVCHMSLKVVKLAKFLEVFVDRNMIPLEVEDISIYEKLLKSVTEFEVVKIVDSELIGLAEKLLNFIFMSPSCVIKVLKFDNLRLMSRYICDNSYCKLKKIEISQLSLHSKSFVLLQQVLDSQDEVEKLEINNCFIRVNNFNYNVFLQPPFKALAVTYTDMSLESFVDIMHQFFLSSYPVSLDLFSNRIILSEFPIKSVEPHPTQHSKSLMVSRSFNEPLLNILPSVIQLKKLLLCPDSVKCFSKLDSIIVECMTIKANDMDSLNSLFHISVAKEWQIEVILNQESNEAQEKFIVGLTNIKGIVTRLCIKTSYGNCPFQRRSVEEAIFTCLQSSLPHLELNLTSCVYNKTHVGELYENWKQCGSIKLKKLSLGYNFDDSDRDVVSLISNF